MNKKLIRKITDNAFIAALYFILTILVGDRAFLSIQFRIAELLIFFVFFRKDFIIGLTLGTLLANFLSPLMPWDIIFGTLATFISVWLVAHAKNTVMGIIYPTIINGIIIGTMLFLVADAPLFEAIGLVMVGEVVVLTFGYFVFKLIAKNDTFMELIMSERGTDYEK